jgi:hypothetical protein
MGVLQHHQESAVKQVFPLQDSSVVKKTHGVEHFVLYYKFLSLVIPFPVTTIYCLQMHRTPSASVFYNRKGFKAFAKTVKP